MKSSPLQLKWVNYPAVSYELADDFDGDLDAPVAVNVLAEVTYRDDGEHLAFVKVDCVEGERPSPYRFSITTVASFTFNLETAKQEYRTTGSTMGLPPIIAVNIARILYAGAREHLALLTARAPLGSAMMESKLLEPNDVPIKSQSSVQDTLRNLFQVSDEEIAAMEERMAAIEKPKMPKMPKMPKKAKRSSHEK